MKKIKNTLRKADRGQAILLIALAMVGLVAFVGLMTDGGILLIEYGKLKRGIDSAAIASAQQFRRGFTGADLAAAAQNFLALNESEADSLIVYRCKEAEVEDGTVHDEDLCTTPLRKLIRVEANRLVNFSFLRIVGIDNTTISASSVGEAASIDLTLIIDTSSSMSYETGGGPVLDDPLDDPSVCNYSVGNPCQPLKDVKDVASDFITTMFFPYDRVSVVALTSQERDGTRDHITVLPLNDDETTVRNAIESLKVFEPPACSWGSPANPPAGPCLNYDAGGTFIGLDCPLLRNGADLIPASGDEVFDPSSCNSSNIGGAIFRAAGEFTREPVRSDSFWVMILLAGGPANATDSAMGFPHGYCPGTTWNVPIVDVDGDGDVDAADAAQTNPNCRDWDSSERHGDGNTDYDADDYARDMGDFVADPVNGQGVTIFTIGLGNLIQNAPKGDPNAGEELLEYVAEVAGDSPGVTANHGFYSYAPTTSNLDEIFESIAENIFTRIAK